MPIEPLPSSNRTRPDAVLTCRLTVALLCALPSVDREASQSP